MRHIVKYLAISIGFVSHFQLAIAAPITCNTSDVRVTAVGQYDGISANAAMTWTNLSPAVNSFACAGAYAGNDMPTPTLNLGYENDGLLNGAKQTTAPKAALFTGGAFITEASPLNDLDGDGLVNDPGWIMLGRYENDFSPMSVGGNPDIVLDTFFSVTYTGAGKGTWELTPDALVAVRAFDVLGKNNFDQFALVFKAANEFAVYDFTALQFGITNPSANDPVFNFSGTFDVSRTLLTPNGRNPAGISHISVWARDPAPSTTSVPEPGTLALISIALTGLGLLRRWV